MARSVEQRENDDFLNLFGEDGYPGTHARVEFYQTCKALTQALEANNFAGHPEKGGSDEGDSPFDLVFYGPDGKTCIRITIEDLGS